LLSVAMTPARKDVLLVASTTRPSPFVAELLNEPSVKDRVVEVDMGGSPVASDRSATPCPRCRTGRIVSKNDKHGLFRGCTNCPSCLFIIEPGEEEDS
jgi:hypothetical protein